MKKFFKNHKWQLTTLSLLAIIALLASMITFSPSAVIKKQWGNVITIGSEVSASTTADFTATGTAAQQTATFQTALNDLPSSGGILNILSGTFTFNATVTRAIANVTIEGIGMSTIFTNNASTPIFTAGGNGWAFISFATDAGGVSVGSYTYFENNLSVNGTIYNASSPVPVGATGRTASYVIASADATATEKAQADVVCSGSSDQIVFQTLADSSPLQPCNIQLLGMDFYFSAPFNFDHNGIFFIGQVPQQQPIIHMENNKNINMFVNSTGSPVYLCGLQNIYLDGNATNNGVSGTGILLDNLYSFIINNCEFNNFITYGVSSSSIYTEGDTIQNSGFSNCGTGLNISNNSLTRLFNLYAASCNVAFNFNGISRIQASQLYADSCAYAINFNTINTCSIQCTSFNISGNQAYSFNGSNNESTFDLGNYHYGSNDPLYNHITMSLSNGQTSEGDTFILHLQASVSISAMNILGGGSSGTLSNSTFSGDVSQGGSSGFNQFSFSNGIILTNDTFNVKGYNPVGQITNFLASGTIGLLGTTSTVTAGTYIVTGVPIYLTSTGGIGVSITIEDSYGNVMASSLTTLTMQYLSVGYKVVITLSSAPTWVVFGN